MADRDTIGVSFSPKGMDAALDPSLVPSDAVARATNMRLEKQLWRTRFAVREVPFYPANDTDVDTLATWRGLNHQGAMFYNPSRGQGALVFGKDKSSIMQSAGGRKYRILVVGRGPKTGLCLEDVTGAATSDPALHLAWWAQAEKYAICANGVEETFIFDGTGAGRRSVGYEEPDRDAREVPNPCSAMTYAHGRLHAVVVPNQIHVGDQIFQKSLTTPSDVLLFSDQQYLETAQAFSPPSSMGNMLALSVMAMKNTQHGHEGIYAHCEDGIFSVNTNTFPRSDWDKNAISRIALLRAAAAGPFAVDNWDGDLVFRSRYGIQTMKSAAAEAGFVGNPYAPISEEVRTFMQGDRESDLRFASLISWYPHRRLFCTVYPMVRMRHRWSRGFVVLNFNPRGTTVTGEHAWEGLWTLPRGLGYPVQFVNGIFTGQERLFMLAWDPDAGRQSVAEVCEWLDDDQLADGTRSRISWQLQSPNFHVGALFRDKKFSQGRLYLRDVRGVLDWGVYWRGNGEGAWKLWRRGKVEVETSDEDYLELGGKDYAIGLGEFPAMAKPYRFLQLMVRGRGVASVEAIKPYVGKPESEDGFQGECSKESVRGTLGTMGYNDYEYTEDQPGARWEELEEVTA